MKTLNWVFFPASAHAIREVGPLCRSVARAAPGTGLVALVYRKDRKRAELARLLAEFPNLRIWVAPRHSRRLQALFLRLAATAGLQRIPYSRVHRGLRHLVRGSLHITLERFFSALDFLQVEMGRDDSLMVSDGRDVVFQGDPFSLASRRVTTGQEDARIGQCATNRGWFSDLYGEELASRVGSKPILCSGVSFGGWAAMKIYLETMAAEIWARFPRIGLRGYFDQAVHNRVIHLDQVPVRPSLSVEGIIATLGLAQPSVFGWDASARVVRVAGKIPAVVHQYDRHPSLLEKILSA